MLACASGSLRRCLDSDSCRCALIGVPCRLRMLSIFSTFDIMLKLTISPQAKRAESDPHQGTPTRAHLQLPDRSAERERERERYRGVMLIFESLIDDACNGNLSMLAAGGSLNIRAPVKRVLSPTGTWSFSIASGFRS